jgi:hypothetical protein
MPSESKICAVVETLYVDDGSLDPTVARDLEEDE